MRLRMTYGTGLAPDGPHCERALVWCGCMRIERVAVLRPRNDPEKFGPQRDRGAGTGNCSCTWATAFRANMNHRSANLHPPRGPLLPWRHWHCSDHLLPVAPMRFEQAMDACVQAFVAAACRRSNASSSKVELRNRPDDAQSRKYRIVLKERAVPAAGKSLRAFVSRIATAKSSRSTAGGRRDSLLLSRTSRAQRADSTDHSGGTVNIPLWAVRGMDALPGVSFTSSAKCLAE